MLPVVAPATPAKESHRYKLQGDGDDTKGGYATTPFLPVSQKQKRAFHVAVTLFLSSLLCAGSPESESVSSARSSFQGARGSAYFLAKTAFASVAMLQTF